MKFSINRVFHFRDRFVEFEPMASSPSLSSVRPPMRFILHSSRSLDRMDQRKAAERRGKKSWKFNIWEIIKNKFVWRHSMNGTTLMTFSSMAWLWSAIASLLDMDSLSFSAVHSKLWHFRSTPSSASLPSNFTETITTDGRRIQQ